MSTSPSPESVEQTKRQIRNLVNEISEISKTDISAAEYYPAVLQRIVSALAAVGGAIWLVDTDGAMKLAYQIQVSQDLLESENEEAIRHARLLTRVVGKGQGELVPPMAYFGEDRSLGNPTKYLLVLCPLASGKKLAGLIEIFQRPDSPPDTQKGYLKFLEHMSKLIGEWLKGQSLQEVSDRQVLWQQSDQFARLVHDNLELRDTAFTIANEGRRLIECDRVSVAVMRGGKAKVIAISGQDTIESRSNIVTALNDLATRVVKSGEPLWYDGSTEDLPPQLEESVEEYVDLSHGRTVTVLPIHRPEKTVEGDIQAKQKISTEMRMSNEIIGALIVEQIETQIPREVLEGRVDLVYEHSCRALANTLSHSQLFMMPVWRALGRATWFFRGSALPKTVAVLTTIALATIAMFIIPIDFDLQGNGSLQPRVQRHVYAHINGEVGDQIPVKHGDRVTAGSPVVYMKNRDLELQRKELVGQLEVTAQSLLATVHQLSNQSQMTKEDVAKINRERAELIVRQESLQNQINVITEKEQQLVRTTPIDGVVTTWKVEEILRARPVTPGQILVSIADVSKGWEVEVLMPEKRMKYLDNAFNDLKTDSLDVEFILMTDPSVTRKGKLTRDKIHQRAEVAPEEGATVKLRVDPDSMEGLDRPGAKVIVDVKCGRRSAAFVWFHEVVEWIRANLLF